MRDDVYLIFVGVDGVQSNKFYSMKQVGDELHVTYGRVDVSESKMVYPLSKWDSLYKSKTKKGYKDISDLKNAVTVVHEQSGNKSFDEFYEIFSKYTRDSVKKTFLTNNCTQKQLNQAQILLNTISSFNKVDDINSNLLELYKVIPRRMDNVRNHLISDVSKLPTLLKREQDAIDAMDSSNITNVVNPYKTLGIDFMEASKDDYDMLEKLIYPTRGNHKVRIHKVYAVKSKRHDEFDNFVNTQQNKECEFLIHGTRNPNVFSILQSGLMIRPTNAAVISGAAYGNGIYHSAHTAKSLNYTGYDSDKIFFIQKVHMGKPYVYRGWYKEGKDLSRNEMNYESLSKKGFDSLFVEAGDGLLNSEYIVYKEQQTVTSFIVWMK